MIISQMSPTDELCSRTGYLKVILDLFAELSCSRSAVVGELKLANTFYRHIHRCIHGPKSISQSPVELVAEAVTWRGVAWHGTGQITTHALSLGVVTSRFGPYYI